MDKIINNFFDNSGFPKTRNPEDVFISLKYFILIREWLKESQKTNIEDTEGVQKLFDQIKAINLDLWDIEDKIRICEKNKDFGKNFIELARKVYLTNDKRSKVKSKINEVLGSNIKEIKHYEDY